MTRRIRHFFSEELWNFDPAECSVFKRLQFKALQSLVLVFRNFWRDQCLLRASALAFTTIISLVPFLALIFAIMSGLGVQHQLEPLVLKHLSAGSQEVASRIIRYINNTNMASLGTVGVLALLVTVFMLLDNVEDSFNSIWVVSETRSIRSKLGGYIVVILGTPALVFSAVSITTFLESRSVFMELLKVSLLGEGILAILHCIPFVVIWAALTFLFLIIPNKKVQFRSALAGALLSGTLWQVAQWYYIHFQIGVARSNAIYGTMAALPVFMIWIYVSWLILLFGVEVVHVQQNIKNLRREMRAGSISFRVRELIFLAILQDVAAVTAAGEVGVTSDHLGENLDLPERLLAELLSDLLKSGFLKLNSGEPATYALAYNPGDILLADVLASIKESGGDWKPLILTRGETYLEELLSRLDKVSAETLAGISLKDAGAVSNPSTLPSAH